MCVTKEMPRYKNTKKIWALKIKFVSKAEGNGFGGILVPSEEGYQAFPVNKDYMDKYNPQVGGYYVQYEGGEEIYMEKEEFEKTHQKIIRQLTKG